MPFRLPRLLRDRRQPGQDARPAWLEAVMKRGSSGDLTPEEAVAVTRVEDYRAALLASPERVTKIDFGAGSPTQRRSEKEMRRGVRTEQVVGELCRRASKPKPAALLLFHLIRTLRPQRCIEMGTCLGVSGAYLGSALRLNGSGRLLTLEGSEALANIAEAGFRSLGLDNVSVRCGPFSETLRPALEAMRPVDFIFVDGHHDGPATRRYFDMIRPYLSPGGVAVFDDIRWSDGMGEAWAYIAARAPSADLGAMGICMNDATVRGDGQPDPAATAWAPD